MDDNIAKIARAIQGLVAEDPTDILLYNGPIDRVGYQEVLDKTQTTSAPTITFLLTTPGGDAGFAFRIARAMTCRYEKFRLLVCGPCKSAGTLIAIGAGEIVMSDLGELGPLDVQIRKRDELLQRESGLDVIQSLDHLTGAAITAFRNTFIEVAANSGLSTRLCADIASNLVTQLYGNIYSQVDPIRLGSVVRANAIAMEYGQRLGSKNLKPDALSRLVLGYPSHDYVIDREQAEELFLRVRSPTKGETALIQAVQEMLSEAKFDEHVVIRLDPARPQQETPKHGDSNANATEAAAPKVGDQPASGSGTDATRSVGADVPAPAPGAGSAAAAVRQGRIS